MFNHLHSPCIKHLYQLAFLNLFLYRKLGQMDSWSDPGVLLLFFLLEIGWINRKFILTCSWSCSKAVQLQSSKTRGEYTFPVRTDCERVWHPFCIAWPPGGCRRRGKKSCNINGQTRKTCHSDLLVDHPSWIQEASQKALWALIMGMWSNALLPPDLEEKCVRWPRCTSWATSWSQNYRPQHFV